MVLSSPAWGDVLTDGVELFLGDGDGLSDQRIAGPASFGQALSGAGDFDGDGLDDVLVSRPEPLDDDLGWVWLYAGTADGLADEPTLGYSEAGDTRVGAALAGAGDVDGALGVVIAAPDGGDDHQGSRTSCTAAWARTSSRTWSSRGAAPVSAGR